MHPDIARTLVEQRRADMTRAVAASRRGPRRHVPRLSVSWSGTSVSRGRSVVIIISATR
jgi:hypothetical protein